MNTIDNDYRHFNHFYFSYVDITYLEKVIYTVYLIMISMVQISTHHHLFSYVVDSEREHDNWNLYFYEIIFHSNLFIS